MRIIVLGLISGCVFSLFATALVVVYRATGILNFAQGAVGMVGTFTFVALAGHVHVLLALAGGIAVAGFLGGLLAVATGPLGDRRLEATVLTLAAVSLLQTGAQMVFGGHPLAVSRLLPLGLVSLPGARVGLDELLAALIALAACGGVVVVMQRSRMGLAARAIASRPSVVAALGIDDRPIIAGSWVVAGMLAGLGGILFLSLEPAPDTATLTLLVIDSFAAALFGRLVSLPGAILGGLIIGVAEQATEAVIPLAGAGEAAMFVVMIAVLGAFPPASVRGAARRAAL